MKKFLYFVAVLLGVICVADAMVPDVPAQAIAPQAKVVSVDPSLRSSCLEAPLIIDNPPEQIVGTGVWFPGKRLIQWHRHNAHRRMERQRAVTINGNTITPQ